jgi:large exoprotein involved in heme utilization and adhesion
LTALPVNPVDSSQQIARGCTSDQGGSFVVTGRGGIPSNPTQVVHSDLLWQDLRHRTTPKTAHPQNRITASEIIEATAWQLTPQGQPQLIAGRPIAPAQGTTCVR